jgi:DNA polymerase-1
MSDTLYVIDGHSQIYRAYYAPFRDLTSPTGEPTRATYVFTSMLLRFIHDRRPQYLAMAVDGPVEKLHRRQLYPDYKVTRKPMPEDLRPQIQRIIQIVGAVGIPILTVPGYEADDVIATLAERFASPQMKVVLISRDKDLDQLVGENVVLYDPMKDETFDAAAIEAAKGYPPSKAVEVQTLMGDSIDNIPGIPGIGPKTAARLIVQYGSADEVVAHAAELTPKLKESILANATILATSRQLVRLERGVPMDMDLARLRFTGLPVRAVRPLFVELGFNRMIEQIDALGEAGGLLAPPQAPEAAKESAAPGAADSPAGGAATAPAAPAAMTSVRDFDYVCINTAEALGALAKELAGVKRIAIDTETTSIHPMWAEMVGLSLAWQAGKGVYLPVKGPLGAQTLAVEQIREKLGAILADPNVEKVGHHLKYDLIILTSWTRPARPTSSITSPANSSTTAASPSRT